MHCRVHRSHPPCGGEWKLEKLPAPCKLGSEARQASTGKEVRRGAKCPLRRACLSSALSWQGSALGLLTLENFKGPRCIFSRQVTEAEFEDERKYTNQ